LRVSTILDQVTRNTFAAVLVALSLVALGLAAPAAVSAEEIFSGTVTQFTDRSLMVIHKVPGHPPVTRQFLRDGGTTIEGNLRSRVRVTVRYKALDNGGFVALHIIVRPVGRAG